MKRPPFKMLPSRHAVARYVGPDGRKVVRSARASYVWQWYVLVAIASGATDSVEIREDRRTTWHRVDYTHDEAYALIVEHYNVGTRRMVESHRRRRGLPVSTEVGSRS